MSTSQYAASNVIEKPFKVGDVVQGNWRGEWHDIKVLDDNLDGTFLILWLNESSFTRRMPSYSMRRETSDPRSYLHRVLAPADAKLGISPLNNGKELTLAELENALVRTTQFCQKVEWYIKFEKGWIHEDEMGQKPAPASSIGGFLKGLTERKSTNLATPPSAPGRTVKDVRKFEIYMERWNVENRSLINVKMQLNRKGNQLERQLCYTGRNCAHCKEPPQETAERPMMWGSNLAFVRPVSKYLKCKFCKSQICSKRTCSKILRNGAICASHTKCGKMFRKLNRLRKVQELLSQSMVPIRVFLQAKLLLLPKGSKSCVRCNQKPASQLLMPCAHMGMCSRCASEYSMCPVCNRDVYITNLESWLIKKNASPFSQRTRNMYRDSIAPESHNRPSANIPIPPRVKRNSSSSSDELKVVNGIREVVPPLSSTPSRRHSVGSSTTPGGGSITRTDSLGRPARKLNIKVEPVQMGRFVVSESGRSPLVKSKSEGNLSDPVMVGNDSPDSGEENGPESSDEASDPLSPLSEPAKPRKKSTKARFLRLKQLRQKQLRQKNVVGTDRNSAEQQVPKQSTAQQRGGGGRPGKDGAQKAALVHFATPRGGVARDISRRPPLPSGPRPNWRVQAKPAEPAPTKPAEPVPSEPAAPATTGPASGHNGPASNRKAPTSSFQAYFDAKSPNPTPPHFNPNLTDMQAPRQGAREKRITGQEQTCRSQLPTMLNPMPKPAGGPKTEELQIGDHSVTLLVSNIL